MNRKTSIIFLVCCVVIFALSSFFRGSSKNDISIGESSLSLAYNEFQTTVYYKDIRTVELAETADFGVAKSGGENRAYRWGVWKNEQWGEYTQYTVKNTDCCVVLTMDTGERLLLSFEGEEATVNLGETLYDMLISRGYEVEMPGASK